MAEVSEVVSSAEEHSENVCTVSISVKGRISLRPFNKSAKVNGSQPSCSCMQRY